MILAVMVMKSSEYWRQRFESLEKSLDAIGQETYFQVEPAFNDALREIDGRIEKWLHRIAVNNKLSMTDARKLLDADQLDEFHWSVWEYIKHGEENAIDQRWMKELENASAKFHISKLEAMKLETQQSLEKAFGNYLDGVDGMTRKVYTEGYYRTAFEIQKGIGVGYSIGRIDEGKLSKLIAKPWAADGRNFSDRIWQSKTQMVNDLHKQLVRTCIMGESPDKAIKAMMKYAKTGVKNAKAQAARLIMTEQAFFASAATKDSYLEFGVKEFEIIATLDSHTSEICRDLDGRHFPMKDYEPGVTAPPFHVYCRSTTCPYFDDEFTEGEMRAARGEDGKTYYVPADMKYEEWHEEQVTAKKIMSNLTKNYDIIKTAILLEKIPHSDRAAIPQEKVQGYLLNSNHPKGKHKEKVIRSVLGYNYETWKEFADKLYEEVQNSPVVDIKRNKYGTKYETHIKLEGVKGKSLILKTVWQIDDKSDIPRLITITFNKRRKKKNV